MSHLTLLASCINHLLPPSGRSSGSPKSVRWKEWPRPRLLRHYIPNGEPRPMVTPQIHQSVLDRMRLVPSYKPINLPDVYDTESYERTDGD